MSTTTEVPADPQSVSGGRNPAVRRPGDLPVTVVEDGAAMLIANAPDLDLGLPFFVDSVARLAADNAPVRVAPMTEFIRRAPAATPAGLVFHVSRCGSTLLAAALEVAASALVLREPSPLNAVLSPPRTVGPRRQLLAASLGWYSALAAERNQRLVVKLPSMATLVAPQLCSAFPDVPSAVVLRHPVRVVASMLRDPAESRSWVVSEVAAERLEPQLNRLGPDRGGDATRWAALWAAMVEAVVPLILDGRIRVVTYQSLVSDLAGVAASLAAEWTDRSPLSGAQLSALSDVAARDAKLPARPFVPTSLDDQLERLDVEAISGIVAPAIDSLAAAGVTLDDA